MTPPAGSREREVPVYMCLRHASVYDPWGWIAVRADRCPLPPDEIGHGDVEAGPEEDGQANPMSWERMFVEGYDGPSAEIVAATAQRP